MTPSLFTHLPVSGLHICFAVHTCLHGDLDIFFLGRDFFIEDIFLPAANICFPIGPVFKTHLPVFGFRT